MESVTAVPVLTIDGPSGAGKGAVSARVAVRLGWHVLDSGAVYRSVALAALESGVDLADEAALVHLCADLDLAFSPGADGIAVSLGGRALGDALRAEAVGEASSRVAAVAPVRSALLDLQRRFRRRPGLVADGRDMGTVVFPDAPVKVFLDASVDERARRRYRQLKENGEDVTFDRLLSDLEARDRRDRDRAVSPTLPAADAVVVDSTALSLVEVVEQVVKIAADRLDLEVAGATGG
ncbi:MAG: (d)CMP kinase [Wenzhouxiangella sp.]|jgi:cytidylate kinase|nr:(d)CMP kinase [Wenzhouxiangella sp.]